MGTHFFLGGGGFAQRGVLVYRRRLAALLDLPATTTVARRRLGLITLLESLLVIGVPSASPMITGVSPCGSCCTTCHRTLLQHLSPQMAMLFVYGLVAAVNVAIRHGGLAVAGHFAVVVGAIVFASPDLGTARTVGDFYWLDLGVGVAVASGLCCQAALPASRTRRALEWVPLVAIGQFSFSLYLVHAPLLAAVWVFFVKPVGLASGAGLALMVFVVMPATVAATGSIGRSSDRS